MATLALGAIGAGASLLGGIFGAGAARRAAALQAQAAQAAAADIRQNAMLAGQGVTSAAGNAVNLMNTATGGAADLYAGLYNEQMARLQPYGAVGSEAANQLLAGLQSGGLTRGFTGADMAAYDPGYAFRLAQGQRGVQAATAATGSTLGGAAAKALNRYNQDYASNEYQNAFNRFMAQQQQRIGVLTSGIGIGQGAANQALAAQTSLAAPIGQMGINAAQYAGGMGLNANEYAGNALMNAANQAAGYTTNAAAAQAAGIVGSNNALWGGISGAAGSLLGGYQMGQANNFMNNWANSRASAATPPMFDWTSASRMWNPGLPPNYSQQPYPSAIPMPGYPTYGTPGLIY